MVYSWWKPSFTKVGYSAAKIVSIGLKIFMGANISCSILYTRIKGIYGALKSLLQGYEHLPFISIVAFSRRATLRVKTETSVIYYHQIPRVIRRTQNEVVSEEEVRQIHSILLANNTEKRVVKRRHIANVKRNALRRNRAVANGYCPRCGGVLTQRKGKYGKFYGCSNYPRCKYMTKKL